MRKITIFLFLCILLVTNVGYASDEIITEDYIQQQNLCIIQLKNRIKILENIMKDKPWTYYDCNGEITTDPSEYDTVSIGMITYVLKPYYDLK